jgi:hypothetical protein
VLGDDLEPFVLDALLEILDRSGVAAVPRGRKQRFRESAFTFTLRTPAPVRAL